MSKCSGLDRLTKKVDQIKTGIVTTREENRLIETKNDQQASWCVRLEGL